jgi:hypothetical protein
MGAALPLALLAALAAGVARAEPVVVVDLAATPTREDLFRAYGSVGTGATGLPVAGGSDCDGDGLADVALGAMRADVAGRPGAGQVFLIFGDGRVAGEVDTARPSRRILRILGAGPSEAAGSEIWMDDVTGDGIADLLIARQNATPGPDRIGAGALSIVVGGPALRERAARLEPIDLAAPPPGLPITTLVGAAAFERLGMWMRTGDVTGDGTADLVVAADQASDPGEPHRGAAYVVRGGPQLGEGRRVDLADFGATSLAGHVALIVPPSGSAHHHFGATCQIADLDGNGRAEVLIAAALNRAGGVLRAEGAPPRQAHGSGGAPRGRLYVAWDDNFARGPWPHGFRFEVTRGPGAHTILRGGAGNVSFGEELLGGLDYDDDGRPDLFVGDLVGSPPGRRAAGLGHVLYDAGRTRGMDFAIDAPPAGLVTTRILGASDGDIAADTAAHGDFDGDGIADLASSSPHASPLGRPDAGVLHVFHGREGPWPAVVDLRAGALPSPDALRVSEILGARGTVGFDRGDTLAYSAAAGDLDGDGRTDVVTNEMVGNGVAPGTVDVGNLIVLGGALFARDDVEIRLAPFRASARPTTLAPARRRPVEVAILGSAGVDVAEVDVASLRFGPGRARPLRREPARAHVADVDRDGWPDLRVAFAIGDTALEAGDRSACLVGRVDAVTFRACAPVHVPPVRRAPKSQRR